MDYNPQQFRNCFNPLCSLFGESLSQLVRLLSISRSGEGKCLIQHSSGMRKLLSTRVGGARRSNARVFDERRGLGMRVNSRHDCLQGVGKTRTHCGGNIADVIMLTRFATRAAFVADTEIVSENLQKHFLCTRGAQQRCRVLLRTGNIAGQNDSATMCARFSGA